MASLYRGLTSAQMGVGHVGTEGREPHHKAGWVSSGLPCDRGCQTKPAPQPPPLVVVVPVADDHQMEMQPTTLELTMASMSMQ